MDLLFEELDCQIAFPCSAAADGVREREYAVEPGIE